MSSSDSAAPDPAALGASMAKNMPPVTGGDTPPPASAASAETGAASSSPSQHSTAPAPAAAPASPEVDAKGRPFDPAQFLTDKATGRPKIDAHGNYLPKSPGRYGRNGEKRPQTPAPSQTKTEPDLFSAPPSAPGSSSSSAASAPLPPSSPGGGGGSFIPPETDLPPPPTSARQTDTDSASKKTELPPEPEAGADDVADVTCDILAEAVGLMTGAPEEAEPSAKEGARLRSVLGAYLRSRGIQTRGIGAVALAFGAWLLRTLRKPKTRAWFREQFRKGKAEPKPAQVIDIDPRPPAAAPSPAPSAAPSERGPASYPVTLARR